MSGTGYPVVRRATLGCPHISTCPDRTPLADLRNQKVLTCWGTVESPLLYSPAAVIIGVQAKSRLQKQLGVSDTFADNIEELLAFDVNSFEPVWRDQIRKYDQEALKAFETKAGMTAMSLSGEDQKAVEEAGIRVRKALAGKVFPEDFMADILRALEAFRRSR